MILLVKAPDAGNSSHRRVRTIEFMDVRNAITALTSHMRHDTSADGEAPLPSALYREHLSQRTALRQLRDRYGGRGILNPKARQVGVGRGRTADRAKIVRARTENSSSIRFNCIGRG